MRSRLILNSTETLERGLQPQAPHLFVYLARLPALLRGSCHPAGAASLTHPTGNALFATASSQIELITGASLTRISGTRLIPSAAL